MGQGSQGLFTQVGFSDPSHEDGPQGHFGVANANPLQSQVGVSFRLNFCLCISHRSQQVLSEHVTQF